MKNPIAKDENWRMQRYICSDRSDVSWLTCGRELSKTGSEQSLFVVNQPPLANDRAAVVNQVCTRRVLEQ